MRSNIIIIDYIDEMKNMFKDYRFFNSKKVCLNITHNDYNIIGRGLDPDYFFILHDCDLIKVFNIQILIILEAFNGISSNLFCYNNYLSFDKELENLLYHYEFNRYTEGQIGVMSYSFSSYQGCNLKFIPFFIEFILYLKNEGYISIWANEEDFNEFTCSSILYLKYSHIK